MQVLNGLLLLVLMVSLWMSWAGGPVARIVLFGSASLISAALFLPSSILSAAAGTDVLAFLESDAKALSWTLATIVHFVAFLWLALVLWTLRADLRGLRIIAGLVVLAGAAELVQGLAVDRTARLVDAGVNLLGAATGLLLAVAGVELLRIARSRRIVRR